MSERLPPKRILITGSSGLVGSALVPVLESGGQHIVRLIRSTAAATRGAATWNPSTGNIDLGQAEPLDAVVHLAGENIAQRWSPAVRQRIRDSRVDGTRRLSEALQRLTSPPRVMICASATGFYGNRGSEWLDESSAPGTGFLAETCREWESAADAARNCGIRVVRLRFGIVLTPQGGALAKMLPAFRSGIAGQLGDGRAYWSWIAMDDLLKAIQFSLQTESVNGPVNAVSPNPVTNAQFTKTLGRVLKRPTILPVPAFALQILFGEMAREAMLASARVKPSRLLAAGFQFRYAELEHALKDMLEKS